MADACCAMCAAMGNRTCDVCGNPCWDADETNAQNRWVDAFGRELCVYCVPESVKAG
jgi:hypothetical protein